MLYAVMAEVLSTDLSECVIKENTQFTAVKISKWQALLRGSIGFRKDEMEKQCSELGIYGNLLGQ